MFGSYSRHLISMCIFSLESIVFLECSIILPDSVWMVVRLAVCEALKVSCLQGPVKRSNLIAKSQSTEVRASSTRGICSYKWQVFKQSCQNQNILPYQCSIVHGVPWGFTGCLLFHNNKVILALMALTTLQYVLFPLTGFCLDAWWGSLWPPIWAHWVSRYNFHVRLHCFSFWPLQSRLTAVKPKIHSL